MKELLDDEMNTVKYVLKVNGVAVSANFSDKMACEMAKISLPEAQRVLAEVVTVTSDGKQVLFG